MKCPNCGKNLNQLSGMWTPKTPNLTYRKYICYDCRIGFTQVVDRDSHMVIRIEENDLSVKRDEQVSLMEWIKK